MFGDWLVNELGRRRWSHSELGRRAGLSQVQVSGVIAGQRSPGCDFCIKVAQALGESPVLVLVMAGILPPQETNDDSAISELIELARNLPPDERQQALDYIRFLYQKRR